MQLSSIKDIVKQYKWYFLLDIFLILIISVVNIFQVEYFSNMIVSATNDTMDKTKMYLLIAFCLTISIAILEIFSKILVPVIANKIRQNYIKQVIDYSKKLKSSTIESTTSGAMVNHIVSSPDQFVILVTSFIRIVNDMIISVLLTVYMFILNYLFGFFMLAYTLISAIFVFSTLKKTLKLGNIFRKITIAYTSNNVETINSHQDIKSLNTSMTLKGKTKNCIQNLDKSRYVADKYRTDITFVNNLLLRMFACLVPILLGILCQEYAFSVASAILILNNFDFVYSLGLGASELYKCGCDIKVYRDDLNELTNVNIYPIDNYGQIELRKLKGQIEFVNVNFSYEYKYYKESLNYDFNNLYSKEMKSKKNYVELKKQGKESITLKKCVFENLSFKIEAGQKVAFVGQSGSGKSTILNLIAKFSECQNGIVKLDGIDIKQLTENTLRNNICMVSQNTYVFNGTIRYNLMLVNSSATEEQLKDACKKANLDEFISTLEKGMDTEIGENGIKLSGGQKQRLAIARAFLKDSQIVIFDESTSALDNESQAHIQESINNFVGKTVIIVAHRLSTIINVDKIYYLQEGVITNSGTFDELIEQDKSFKELFLAENI